MGVYISCIQMKSKLLLDLLISCNAAGSSSADCLPKILCKGLFYEGCRLQEDISETWWRYYLTDLSLKSSYGEQFEVKEKLDPR